MIRPFTTDDLSEVMRIWLTTNIETHSYIDSQYWIDNFDEVKEIIPHSEVYVYASGTEIEAFVGIIQGYIAGIFVKETMQSKGIGKQLLEKCKELYSNLTLKVYEKNTRAVSFYQREGFNIDERDVDEKTGEIELLMSWEINNK